MRKRRLVEKENDRRNRVEKNRIGNVTITNESPQERETRLSGMRVNVLNK